jgi:nucleotide-binding universal stress UspA family protein
MAFQKILCPIDFSDGSREAMRVASQLATGPGASVTLVHVWQMPGYPLAPMAGDIVQGLVDDAERELAVWKGLATGLGIAQVTTRFVTGAPWHEVVELARADVSIDLIVIGTHGRTGLAHALLGSVAEKVVRHAPCPVLVARARA